MSLRTAMLKLEDKLFKLYDPQHLDQTTTVVTIVTRTWAGGEVDAAGGFTDSNLILPQKFPVEQVTVLEEVQSGGNFTREDVKVTQIVPNDPSNPGIGFTPAQLAPNGNEGVQILYVLQDSTGAFTGEWVRIHLDINDPYEYTLYLRRRMTTPTNQSPFNKP